MYQSIKRRFYLLFFIFTLKLPLLSAQERPSPHLHPTYHNVSSQDHEISDWEARLDLARSLSYMKQYNESIQQYQKLLEIDPSSAIARRELAAVFFYSGNEKRALEEFSQVSDKDRDDKTWLVIADICLKQENYPHAEMIYSTLLKNDPKNDKIRLKLASLLSWEKKYPQSIEQYEIILKNRPQDIQVRRRYAQVLTWMGNEQAAIEEWKKTLE